MSLSKAKRKVDEEHRQFQERWTSQYFFVEFNGSATCLICKEKVAVLKEYNLKRHYSTKHADAAVEASYVLSELIVKAGKPFTEGQFLKDCMLKVTDGLCPEKKCLFQNISLSPNAVAERTGELARNI